MTLTRQEAFTKSYLGLRAQGQLALTTPEERAYKLDLTTCAYRTPTGLKCAIGQLIPDDKYRPSMEGCLTVEILTVCDLDPCQDFQFASTMQLRLHDSLENMTRDFYGAAVEFARDYGLEIPRD